MTAAMIALAKAYPYRLSECSLVVDGGAVRPFDAAGRRFLAKTQVEMPAHCCDRRKALLRRDTIGLL